MRCLVQLICFCLFLAAGDELLGQNSVPPVSKLHQAVSNLTAAVSSTSDPGEAFKVYGRMAQVQKYIVALLPVLDAAAERSDRTASEFRKKADDPATVESNRAFYRDKAASLAKSTDQVLTQRAELETVEKSLAQAMAKVRNDPTTRVLIETDEAFGKLDEKAGAVRKLNDVNQARADFIKSVTPPADTPKGK